MVCGTSIFVAMGAQEYVQWRLVDRLVSVPLPAVMGIVNATPDSFHSESRATRVDDALRLAERMVEEGATFIDVGGASSRPNAQDVQEEEELRRALPVVSAITQHFPEVIVSVDTWHARVARECVQAGGRIVNDISGGLWDPHMLRTVAQLGVPYVAMHVAGPPHAKHLANLQGNVAEQVVRTLSERAQAAQASGIADVLLDPGFGFGKTTAQNHALLHELERLTALGKPVLVGLSRKRMVNEVLGTEHGEGLNGTTVLHTLALLKGASVLRVHDVRAAMDCIALLRYGATAVAS
jgi:dihydropteroate synthase